MSEEPPDPVPSVEVAAAGELTMGFVGVSTSRSSIMRIFPHWAELLGLPTRNLVGHDLPLDATPAQYRELVRRIRDDDAHLGALVTSHKIGVYQHCVDLFDEVDEFAGLCGEISSISKRDGRLVGHAKDPLTVGLAAEEFLPTGHFEHTGADVVCLGAGGAGTAATWYLSNRPDPPRKIICSDADPGRLAHLQKVQAAGRLDPAMFSYEVVQRPEDSDTLVASARPGSLVINATGLGKDRPGSPISDACAFPPGGVVWELNYRGGLDFLHQAERQQQGQRLQIVDGWRYFIHGWTQVIAEVFDIPMPPSAVDTLSRVAQDLR